MSYIICDFCHYQSVLFTAILLLMIQQQFSPETLKVGPAKIVYLVTLFHRKQPILKPLSPNL
jgi:hypothetical protein